MNLVRQKTCKTLLQVKQSFVIHLALQAATRLPLALLNGGWLWFTRHLTPALSPNSVGGEGEYVRHPLEN
jgi:hypothetical protein